jgi:hypothetical protein
MDEENGTQQDPGEGSAGSAGGADWANQATRAWQDVVAGAVRTASEVINEQIRMGQRTAQDLNDRFYDMGGGGSSGGQFQDAWFRPWADLTARWFEMMGSMAGGSPGARAGSGAASAPVNGTARPVADTATRLVINSQRPTTVDVDLPAGAVDLICDPLRSVDADVDPLTVTLVTMPNALVTLRLDVPETQPAGTYRGSVRERATNQQVGQITIDLAAGA